MALEKPGKLWDFFLLLCGHPGGCFSVDALQTSLLMMMMSEK